MRFSLHILGTEIVALELGTPPPYEHHPDLTGVSRHGGDFGFGASPARPYWTSEPGEAPAPRPRRAH